MTAEEVLAEAARRVELPGHWWQQNGEANGGSEEAECMWLACSHQLRDGADIGHLLYGPLAPVRDAILKEIDASLRYSLDPIYKWNDRPGRTQEEVATTLRNAKRWL